jgi:hypothetical protein
MAELMVAYQLYDLVTMFLFKELYSHAMLVHHLLTLVLAVAGLYGYMHGTKAGHTTEAPPSTRAFLPPPHGCCLRARAGQCYFFFGVIESTNIPLTLIDIFKYFPVLIKRHGGVYVAFRMLFAASFALFRLVLWPMNTYSFWMSVLDSFTSGKVAQAQVFGDPTLEATVALTFLLSNAALTVLQVRFGGIFHPPFLPCLPPPFALARAPPPPPPATAAIKVILWQHLALVCSSCGVRPSSSAR